MYGHVCTLWCGDEEKKMKNTLNMLGSLLRSISIFYILSTLCHVLVGVCVL